MTRITTILSDLGNVVVRFDNSGTIDTMEKLSRNLPAIAAGREIDVKRILFDHRAGLWNLFDRGFVHEEYVLGTILASVGAGGTHLNREDVMSVAREAWQDIFVPNDPVVGLWKKLRGMGKTLTAVSNIDALRWAKLEAMGVSDMFDHLVLSFEERMIKQDGPEIFARALDRSGCKAEDALFVDDRQDCVDVAASLGIRTFRYDWRDHKALERELMLLGLPLLA